MVDIFYMSLAVGGEDTLRSCQYQLAMSSRCLGLLHGLGTGAKGPSIFPAIEITGVNDWPALTMNVV